MTHPKIPFQATAPTTARRMFLKSTVATGAAVSVPYFGSTQSSFAAESKSKNAKMSIGVIGAGGMANGNINTAKEWLDVVAVADVDAKHREAFGAKFSGGKADLYEDYRAILDRDDIDIIHIATPDHWHTKPLIEAMLAGKDVYCEKPLTLTIDEGKKIREVQKKTGRIVQVGTQQRSTFNLFVKAMALVADGRLGRIQQVQAAIGSGPSSPEVPVAPIPKELNWDRWLGPTPKVPYRYLAQPGSQRAKTNCHFEFRWWYDYSGGKLTDWGAHHVDICNWALKLNGQTAGPLSISGSAKHPVEFQDGYPVQKDRYNTTTQLRFTVKYPGDTELIIRSDTRSGVLITGDKGRIFVSRGSLTGKPVEDLVSQPLPEDAISKVYKGLPMEFNERKAHWANFLHCVRERKEPISDVHSHMQMLNVCHLAGISARLGRDLQWDDTAEQIVGDDQANRFLSRPYREGYEIEM
ncbi:Gfo/Idh/MocA family protein [Novipirellula artificiosorum]|uniref:Inositol 2-dehydrogenase n=1 Tax=Novipirellula artificiosorum TaxID=2528016 RepID=A0A5C6DM10_9BACT|nr:Gfo/Idh/MocA family oxidoreductase [Novipirellula artificiosorum]TWU35956.1 Inositol 2-dehydrogenase [Novipirellula artificiosorum]